MKIQLPHSTILRKVDSKHFILKVVTTTAYVIRKDYSKNKICEIMDSLNKKIILLPCAAHFIKNASGKLPPDFEDALLYEIALHHQLDYFITSNIKDFTSIQSNILPVMNARDFNKFLLV